MSKMNPSTGTRRRMPAAVCLVLAALAAGAAAMAAPAAAQERPQLWLVAHGDTVLVHVPEPPVANHGFVVYRTAAGGSPELLTPEPVLPVRQPALAAALLGDDLPRVMDMLRATDDVQALRRLEADRVAAGVASMLFRPAAVVLGRFFADTTAVAGAEYEYRVVFLDALGEETTEARTGSVRVADVPPPAVAGLAATAGSYEAALSWRFPVYTGGALDFVLGFHVYRAGPASDDYERLTDTPVLRGTDEVQRYVDRRVRNDESYRYIVRAVDLAGRAGAAGDAVAVRPFDDSPPSVPANVVTEPGDGEVRLAWRMSPELNVVGYLVERSTGLDQPFERIVTEPVPVSSPTWLDASVRGGTQYFYRVVAINEHGRESRPSNAISALPYDETPPEPPVGVAASARGRSVEVRWGPSPSDDVQGYHVYRGEVDGELVRLTTRPVAATEFIDAGFGNDGLRPGGRYIVRVSAVDHSLNESESVVAGVVIADDEPPVTPTALHAQPVEGRLIELTWMPGGSHDVARYVVTRTAAGAPDTEIASVAASAPLRVRDTDVVRGAEYVYRLVAVDSAGNLSEPIETRLVLRGTEPPPAPRHVSARVEQGGGVSVEWERVVDDELVGYRVYRATIPTGVYEPVSGLIPVGAPLSITDRDGAATHFYTVRAVDRSGNESRPSPAVQPRQQ
jgi:fibronectin type 3 domain-containing protein